MPITVSDLWTAAERLESTLEAYESFLDASRGPDGEIRTSDFGRPGGADEEEQASPHASGVAITNEVLARYRAASDSLARYVERVRGREQPDWSAVVTETEPVREAILAVHAAGYGTSPRTGESGYFLPVDLCPARRVSMNAGSSPVTFPDRVAQYRAVVARFDIEADVVYYPGSGHDVSPTAAFPGADFTYVDVDVAAMDDLVGHDAVWADATEYELPEGADVIVFRNAGLVEEAVVETNLRSGGWVLANDHLESARHMAGMDCMELVGVVPDDWSGDTPPVETTGLNAIHTVMDGQTLPRAAGADRTMSPLDLYVFRDRSEPDLHNKASKEVKNA